MQRFIEDFVAGVVAFMVLVAVLWATGLVTIDRWY